MSPRSKTVLALLGSLLLGGGLLFLALRGVDFGAVGEALRTADYIWLLPLLVTTLLAHLLRAWRWRLLLDTLSDSEGALPEPVSLRLAFYSVMIGYMVNYAAPRAGEVARAANVASQTRLRFPGVFGTVVAERVLDVLTLGVALLTVLALFRERLAAVFGLFAQNTRAALEGVSIPWTLVLVGLLAASVAMVLIGRALLRREGGLGGRVAGLARSFGEGLVSLLRVRQRGALVLSAAAIWFCYLLMADFPLRLFGLSGLYDLGLTDSWALMNVGAIGMALPSPGGTGSYHYVTVQTLVYLFGVAETPAATYALFSHAAQLVLYAVGGFVCLLLQGSSLASLKQTTATAQAEAEDAHEPIESDPTAPRAEAPAGP